MASRASEKNEQIMIPGPCSSRPAQAAAAPGGWLAASRDRAVTNAASVTACIVCKEETAIAKWNLLCCHRQCSAGESGIRRGSYYASRIYVARAVPPSARVTQCGPGGTVHHPAGTRGDIQAPGCHESLHGVTAWAGGPSCDAWGKSVGTAKLGHRPRARPGPAAGLGPGRDGV